MATWNPLFFSPLLCMFAALCVSSFPVQAANSDFFYLTIKWPGSACNNASVPFSRCCQPWLVLPALDFLIESMETYDSYTEKMVTKCTTNCPYATREVKDFIEDMYVYWPDVGCPPSSGMRLWKSNFCTYGVCSNLTEKQYFERGLALYKNLDLLVLLGKKGIVPSDTKLYDLEDIESALRTKYPFSFVVECSRNKAGGYQLYKIRYCVSMDGKKFITCPISRETNCGDEVKFPVFTYNMLEVERLSMESEANHINRDEIM